MMTQQKYLPRQLRAIASSYLIRQTAGAERVGGLEIYINRLSEPKGEIRVVKTFLGPDEVWNEIGNVGREATAGIVEYAKEHNINLAWWDIELRKFLFHPVNSRNEMYFFAAQNAFQAALNACNAPLSK